MNPLTTPPPGRKVNLLKLLILGLMFVGVMFSLFAWVTPKLQEFAQYGFGATGALAVLYGIYCWITSLGNRSEKGIGSLCIIIGFLALVFACILATN